MLNSEDWGNFARSTLLILFTFLCIIGVLYLLPILIERLHVNKVEVKTAVAGISVDLSSEGALLVSTEKELGAVYYLPAAAGWSNTGISVPSNSVIEIIASGKAALAADYIIDAARSDEISRQQWTGPGGTVYFETNERYRRRRPYLLFSADSASSGTPRIGQLVGYLSSEAEGATEPDLENNPRPKNIFEINSKRICLNTGFTDHTLWVTINEVVLDATAAAKTAFIGYDEEYLKQAGNTFDDPKVWKRAEVWPEIIKRQYFGIFFDDNLGGFLVTAKVRTLNDGEFVAPCQATQQ